MRIFLDGLDAAGKSTCAEMLQRKYGFSTFHSNGKSANTYLFFRRMFDDDNVVYDRCFVGEVVYTELYKRKQKLSDDSFAKLVQLMKDKKDVLVLFACSDLSIIYDRLRARHEEDYFDEMQGQQDGFMKIAELFKDYEYFYLIDVSKRGAYKKLYSWLDKVILERQ